MSVVRRSKEQKAHSGERLNMDNQQLTACPRLVEEEKLRLLNYQSNSIRQIQNLDGTTKPAHKPPRVCRRVGAGIRPEVLSECVCILRQGCRT